MDGEMIIEPASSRQMPTQTQPVAVLGSLDPVLSDAAVRQAIVNAEASNLDPQTLTISDMAQPPVAPQAAPTPVEVPQKFLKPDGEVDVDKIQASTRQLDEAIQKKEEAVKTVDDYMREFNEREKKFHSLPNADKTLAQLPQPAPTQQIPQSQQDYEAIVRRDYEVDPLGTTTRLFNLMLEQKFQPIEEQKKAEATRSNVQKLAEKDPRFLRHFDAVNAKLQADPDLWKLKDPHKAAWLDVKEELRLGEPLPAQALPSRPSPVLGGGTPPSAPSASVGSPQNVIGSLHNLDLTDKKQEAMGDAAIRALLAQNRG